MCFVPFLFFFRNYIFAVKIKSIVIISNNHYFFFDFKVCLFNEMRSRYIEELDFYMAGSLEDCPLVYQNLHSQVNATASKQVNWVISY